MSTKYIITLITFATSLVLMICFTNVSIFSYALLIVFGISTILLSWQTCRDYYEIIWPLEPGKIYQVESDPVFQNLSEDWPITDLNRYIATLTEIDKRGNKKNNTRRLYRVPDHLKGNHIFRPWKNNVGEIKITILDDSWVKFLS